jgi:hypothetical protein
MPSVSGPSLTGGSAGRTLFVLLNLVQPARGSKPDALKLILHVLKLACCAGRLAYEAQQY